MGLSRQRASTTTSAPFNPPWKYDVFLSFRGEDTRRGFTNHLLDKLKWRAIKTFRDDSELERGTTISRELLVAIEQSRLAIIVLSPNYASSTWCLAELTKILQCMEARQMILPIFYDVEPTDVRHQTGSFAEAFTKHEEKLREEDDLKEVQGWRDALTKVANIAGWTSKEYRYETELIKEIVEVVWNKVHPMITMLDSSEMLVGIDSKLKKIDLLLDIEANEVCFVGIWGMGGIGKTTLARLVYEKISHSFEVSIFLANVREISATHGLVHLQKQLLSQALKEKDIQVWDVYSGMVMTKSSLCNKKVLLVLDDVDQLNQLENLGGEKFWFGLGSRIIITTRDQHLLVTHGLEKQYEVVELDEDEASQLFNWKAFKRDEPEEDYLELSKHFVKYAGGLPLALKTLGSFLHKRGQDAWKSALDKLKQTPDRTTFETLKISYDGPDEMEKSIFLDIACFHKWCDKERVVEILDSYGFCTCIVIDVLVEKSLLTISGKSVSMHDLIQEMAWEIVRCESYKEPGGRSRLWLRNDIFHVLMKNTGTEAIEGMVLHLHKFEEEAHWNPEAFSKMCKLKFLSIDNLRLSVGPKYLPDALRFLQWSWYPSKFLPPKFQPEGLTELSLQHSKIDHLWDGIKYLGKLKSIDLSYSQNLTKTPDFTGILNLEKLVLEGCTNLVKIHSSIAFLKRLKILNFKNCKSIQSLPSELEMESLEVFDISGCSKVKEIPEFVGQLKNLSKLSLSWTAVEKMPLSFEHLIDSLEELDLSGIAVREPPSSLVHMEHLQVSSFCGCNGPPPQSRPSFLPLCSRKRANPVSLVLAYLKDFASMKKLDLSDCNLCEGAIPNGIGCLSTLKELNLGGNNFVTLPASISSLSKLSFFNLKNCKRLQQLPELPLNSRLFLKIENCTSLKVLPGPPELCRLRRFVFSSVNCLSLVGIYQGSINIIFSLLMRFLQEIPHFVDRFSIIIPGSEIPEWFRNQSVGDSVTEKLPSHSSKSKWMGFALCAIFVTQENAAAVREVDYLRTYANEIRYQWKIPGSQFRGVAFYNHLDQVASDHIWLILLSRQHDNFWQEKCCQIKFNFSTRRAVGNNKCLKVKKCGVRSVYEQDMEELNRIMNKSSNKNFLCEEAMHIRHCDFDRSANVQAASVQRTHEPWNEAGSSRS